MVGWLGISFFRRLNQERRAALTGDAHLGDLVRAADAALALHHSQRHDHDHEAERREEPRRDGEARVRLRGGREGRRRGRG